MVNQRKVKGKAKLQQDIKFGVDPKADLEVLLNECREKLPSVNEKLIRKAFNFCLDAHRNKMRASGEPYYVHPLNVARIVVNEIPLDDISVASALMHDVLNYSDIYDYNSLRKEFGSTIADIVDGVTKIKLIEQHTFTSLEQVENYRKMLLTLFKDVRILLIKLADRLHNIRTMRYLSRDKRIKIAEETLEIYAPFANRFGLRHLKWELEDLSFKILNKIAYSEIRQSLQGTRKEREEYIKEFNSPISEKLRSDEFLKKHNIRFTLSGRAKHIYSIYNKMKLRQKGIDELYDLFAVRIILDTDDNNMCFYVYGLVAGIYPPVPETFKDYINSPKKNGYQSIHTAVIGPQNKSVEIQIRTRKMDEVSEQGVAAHFRYKPGEIPENSSLDSADLQSWMDLVREIFENAGEETPMQLIENARKILFRDEIYVFTPKNEFKVLPVDATPVDFAYSIHTAIGERCISAKANGKIVPIDYKLQSGDQVEIITSKNHTPEREWLNFVVTTRAKVALHKYFRDERKRVEDNGKKIWGKNCLEFSLSLSDKQMKELLTTFKFSDDTDFYYALGGGTFNVMEAVSFAQYKFQNDESVFSGITNN